jgi:hypothetical protein
MVAVIDCAGSYMTFLGHDGGNIARIQLDAACTLTSAQGGTAETYDLIAPCRAERMDRDTTLLQVPNFEFCGIFATDVCLLIRTHSRSDRDNRAYGRDRERFADVLLGIRTHARPLLTAGEIIAATRANTPLAARTTLHDPAEERTAVLDYPVKTMNIPPQEGRLQVDTGPVLLPDFAATPARATERFDTAYVLYHQFTEAEFILRRPVPLHDVDAALTDSVTDHSRVTAVTARNELFAIDA